MKNKLFAVLAVMAMGISPLLAQTPPTKIGYTNVDVILGRLPDAKKIQNQLEVTKEQLNKALQEKIKEFQDKLAIYEKNQSNMTDVIQADKRKELENLQASIQEFERNSQVSLQTKYQQLLDPVMKKIDDAIKAVGKEQGYLYIINSESGQGGLPVLLFVASEDYNVTDSILIKLGVDPKAVEQPEPATPAAATPAPAAKPAAKPAQKK